MTTALVILSAVNAALLAVVAWLVWRELSSRPDAKAMVERAELLATLRAVRADLAKPPVVDGDVSAEDAADALSGGEVYRPPHWNNPVVPHWNNPVVWAIVGLLTWPGVALADEHDHLQPWRPSAYACRTAEGHDRVCLMPVDAMRLALRLETLEIVTASVTVTLDECLQEAAAPKAPEREMWPLLTAAGLLVVSLVAGVVAVSVK